MIFNIVFITITVLLLIISFVKDRKKTLQALKKAWKAFENILPEFLAIIVLVGFVMAILNKETIAKIIGNESGILGIILSGVVGSVTLIPGFIAFPTAAILLKNGAGVFQIGTFVSALMMVGIVTLPLEIKYFGKKFAIIRNSLSFIFSFLVGLIIYIVVEVIK